MILERPSDIARFLDRVPPRPANECWIWRGASDGQGYGAMRVNSLKRKAHRLAFSFYNQTTIPDGLVVRHTCDTPMCVNPRHLLLGTQKDNVADRKNRGREGRHEGVLNGRAVLTEAHIPGIRRRASEGESLREISDEFGLTRQAIWRIVHRRTWLHV